MKYFDSKAGKNQQMVFNSCIRNNYNADFLKSIGFLKKSVVLGNEVVIKKSILRLKKLKQARHQSIVTNYESPMKKNSFIDPMVFKEGLSYIHRVKANHNGFKRRSVFQGRSNEEHKSDAMLRKFQDSIRSEKNPGPYESLEKEAKVKFMESSKETRIQIAAESIGSIKQNISKPFKQAKTMILKNSEFSHINNISAWSEEF